jgi:hypothetical protein
LIRYSPQKKYIRSLNKALLSTNSKRLWQIICEAVPDVNLKRKANRAILDKYLLGPQAHFDVEEAIIHVIKHKRSTVVAYLIDVYANRFAHINASKYNTFITAALKLSLTGIVRMILRFDPTKKSMVTRQHLVYAVWWCTPAIINLTLNCLPSDFDLNPKTQATNFLFSAISYGKHIGLQALLDRGADINVVLPPDRRTSRD